MLDMRAQDTVSVSLSQACGASLVANVETVMSSAFTLF